MSKNNFDIEHFPTNPTALRMMSRISPIYDRSYVGKWIFEVMGLDMDEVRLRFNELSLQAFPETATWGLIYWEQRYGLPVGEGFDFEVRRRPILAHRRSHAPLNPKRVEGILSALTGREVIITENVADYTFRVKVEPGDDGFDLSELMRTIKKIKPSHQAYNLQVEFETVKVRTAAFTEIKQTVEIWPEIVSAVTLAPARILTAAAVHPRASVAVLPGTIEKVSATAEVHIGAGVEAKTAAQVWPGTVERAEGTAEVGVRAAAQQAITGQVWPGTVERVEGVAEVGVRAATQQAATAQVWPATVERVEGTAETRTGAASQQEAAAQVWPGTAQQVEATAEVSTAAGTQHQNVTRIWPGAVEHVETKTGASGVVVEIHQTIEIWP